MTPIDLTVRIEQLPDGRYQATINGNRQPPVTEYYEAEMQVGNELDNLHKAAVTETE